ncbi:class D sortase [Candidatus Roizmanbacteria bacterium]|nr:class D sortase [Candidatus Roizmanbacteria bacterium]
MALHSYVKKRYSLRRQIVHVFSYLSLVAGAVMLFWSFYPIISFEVYSRLFIEQDIASPIPRSTLATNVKEASSILGSDIVYSNNLRDFAQAHLWFPTSSQTVQASKVTLKDFYITIPKINISRAHVVVGGENLTKSLVHYMPASLPGEYGNVAIFGHSTLPQLYNVNDYKTIFTYLPSMEKGDKIIVKVGSDEYEYEVFEMFVVKPEQVSVLEQKYDAAYLTLVTCVPPGTYWNRLVVRAKMNRLPQNLY